MNWLLTQAYRAMMLLWLFAGLLFSYWLIWLAADKIAGWFF